MMTYKNANEEDKEYLSINEDRMTKIKEMMGKSEKDSEE